jgi:hypothetical protein
MSQPVVTPTVQAGPARIRRPIRPLKLKAERVQEELAAMGWEPAANVRTFGRVFKFPASRVAGSYAAFVTELAGQSGQPVTVSLAGKQVTVTLLSRSRKGRPSRWSTAVLEFAKRLAA